MTEFQTLIGERLFNERSLSVTQYTGRSRQDRHPNSSVVRKRPLVSRLRAMLGFGLGGVMVLGLLQGCVACAEDGDRDPRGSEEARLPPSSVLARYKLNKSADESEKLPKRLAEISGLAVTADGRLLAHDDEHGIVYELEVDHGKIVKSFQLGAPAVAADFEGIAIAEGSLFLVTSRGTLFETSEGQDGEVVDFTMVETGVGDVCEVEGLAYDLSDRHLLLACKTTRGSRYEGKIVIFRWSIDSRRLDKSSPIEISRKKIRKMLSVKEFHPSGIEIHAGSGSLFVIAARERAIIEVSRDGDVLNGRRLKAKRHAHPEGIALGVGVPKDYDLIISDEAEEHRARLTRYRMRKSKNAESSSN